MSLTETCFYSRLYGRHFKTIPGHFFATYMFIFHKTEIQTVILRCLTSLNPNWHKSYDKNHKNIIIAKDAFVCFWTKLQKKKEMEIFAFCVLTFEPIISKTCSAPQNDCHNLSFVKDEHTYGKKWSEKVVQRSFIKGHSFRNSLYFDREMNLMKKRVWYIAEYFN
jgi:hypothetical protein